MRQPVNNSNSNFRNVAFFALVFVLGLSSISLSQQPFTVVVDKEVSVSSDRVDLGSIASIPETAYSGRLKKISLGYAPNIGSIRQIACDQISLSIRAAGFTESEVSLNCSRPVIVRRVGQTITEEMVRDAVTTSLEGNFSGQPAAAKFTRLEIPENISVPTGVIELVPDWSGIRNMFAPFPLPVRVRIDGKLHRTLTVNAEVEAYADVLVAAREMAANSMFAENDVRIEKLRLTRPVSHYVTDFQKLAGTITTRELRPGEAITSDLLASIAVIKAGDPVRIEAHSGNLKLVITGEAKAAGRIGDRIAVKNTQSGVVLQAVVVDRGRVKVSF